MLLLFSLLIFKSLSQFTKTITIPTQTVTNDTNTTITTTENIQSRSTRIYSDPNRGTCMCDMIINICDSLCCCDTRCSQTLITEWTENSKCIDQTELQSFYYPECQTIVNSDNNFDKKYHLNQINDIMCSAVQRLPYAGIYANIEDTQTLSTIQNGFDLNENMLFTLYQNPQNIDPKIVQYSGNPGYIKGKPLMIGKFTTANMNLNWVKQFKIYAWDKTGICSTKDSTSYNPDVYKVINFGEDLVITCVLPDITLSSYCNGAVNYELMRAFIYDGGTNYYYVGKWGSSNNNNTKEWIQINKTSVSNIIDICVKPIYQQLTIYYQKVGVVGDLQNTIIAVNITDIPIYKTEYLNNPTQLTLKVKFIELISSEVDPNTQKSFTDTITPYVRKIFQPFSYAYLMNLVIFIYMILQ